MNTEYIVLHERDPKLPKIRLLLLFMKGDNRIPDAFEWSLSIGGKIQAMEILFKWVLDQIPNCLNEIEEARKRGYGNGIQSLILALKYETFLNSIYSLCENIGMIVCFLYQKESLPQSFSRQKRRFLEKDIDPVYAGILKNTDWYDEVHSMRAEAVHYLSGFITITDSTTLGYFNRPKSRREHRMASIRKEDIEEHVNRIYDSVQDFLLAFGDHFIHIIDQDVQVALLCIRTSSGGLGARKISLREYLNGKPGSCFNPNFDCPRKNSC